MYQRCVVENQIKLATLFGTSIMSSSDFCARNNYHNDESCAQQKILSKEPATLGFRNTATKMGFQAIDSHKGSGTMQITTENK